ncbi:MAG TPA: hypothetical protein VF185_00300 [Patescibacteria group bacterium]
MDSLPSTFLKIFIVFVLFCFFGLGLGFMYLNSKIDSLTGTNTSPIFQNIANPTPQSNFVTKEEVQNLISLSVSSQSATTVPVATKTPTPTPIPTATPRPTQSTPKITYIPIGVSGSTQATGWTDVASSDFYLNFANDYGSLAAASWDAVLRVGNSNGTAYARLFDVTHGIGVDGSEINLTNTATATDVESGYLRFWAGKNLYRVQIKSLNSSTTYFDFGRIKVSY